MCTSREHIPKLACTNTHTHIHTLEHGVYDRKSSEQASASFFSINIIDSPGFMACAHGIAN